MIYKQLYPTNDWLNPEKVIENSEKNLEELQRIDSEQPKDSLLYRYYRKQYADGWIFYQVINVSEKTCTVLACEGINLDEWKTGLFTVDTEHVKEMIDIRIKLENLLKK